MITIIMIGISEITLNSIGKKMIISSIANIFVCVLLPQKEIRFGSIVQKILV